MLSYLSLSLSFLPPLTQRSDVGARSYLFGITVIGFINRVLPSYPISIIVLGITRAITRPERAEEFLRLPVF